MLKSIKSKNEFIWIIIIFIVGVVCVYMKSMMMTAAALSDALRRDGDYGLHQLRVDELHQLLYCAIAKNANTKFTQLWFALATNGTRMAVRQGFGVHEAFAKTEPNKTSLWMIPKLLKQTEANWKLMVVVRDLAERLVSSFRYLKHGNDSEFKRFAENVVKTLQKRGGFPSALHNHIAPQWTACGLHILHPNYVDYKLVYGSDIAQQTEEFLEKEQLNRFYHGWGRSANLTLFEEKTVGRGPCNQL